MGFEPVRFPALMVLLACQARAGSRADLPEAIDTTVNPAPMEVLESDDPSACGGLDEPCCRDRSLICAPGLRCQPEEGVCRFGDAATSSALCRSDADCQGDAVCCVHGLVGTCRQLAAGEACPLPDLTLLTAPGSIRAEDRRVQAGSCAVELGCIRATAASENVLSLVDLCDDGHFHYAPLNALASPCPLTAWMS